MFAFTLVACSTGVAPSNSSCSATSTTSSASSLPVKESLTLSHPIWQLYVEDELTLMWGEYVIPSYLTGRIKTENLFLGDWITLNCLCSDCYQLEETPMSLVLADYECISIEQTKGRCVEVRIEAGVPAIEEKSLSFYSGHPYEEYTLGRRYALDESGVPVPLSTLEKAYAWTNEMTPNIVYGYTTYSL